MLVRVWWYDNCFKVWNFWNVQFQIPRRSTPRKVGWWCSAISQNPYPIDDQNLRFSLLYLWPGQKFDTLAICDRCGWRSCPKLKLWWVFVNVLIDNDEKVASSKKHIQFKTRVLKPYPIFKRPKWPKSIPHLWNPTLWGRTYLYSPYKEVPPGFQMKIEKEKSDWKLKVLYG